MKIQEPKYNSNEYWYDAFGADFMAVWGDTPFMQEVPHLCHMRAYTCFWGREDQDITDRRKLLYNYMRRVFSVEEKDDTLNKWFGILPSESRMLRRAVRNLCIAYNQPPSRRFRRNENAVSDTEQLILNRWYNQGSVDIIMQQAYRIAKLMNTMLIHVAQVDGVPVLTTFTPDLFRVRMNAKNKHIADEVWIPVVIGRNLYYKVWIAPTVTSRGIYKLIDASNMQVKEQVELSYDRLPFVTLRLDGNTTDFYGGGLFELVEGQLRLNRLDVVVDENVFYNAIGVWMGTNLDVDPRTFRLSPGRFIQVEGVVQMEGGNLPPLLEHINAQTHYSELAELRNNVERSSLQNEGLPSSAVNKETAATLSGVAMEIDQKELVEMRDEDINVLLRAEQQLLELLVMVMNADAGTGMNPEGLSVSVDFAEQRTYLDAVAQYELNKKRFQDGLISPLEYVKSEAGIDTISTDEAAMQYLRDNKAKLFNAEDNNAQAIIDTLSAMSPAIATKVLEKLSDDEIRSLVGLKPAEPIIQQPNGDPNAGTSI